MYVGQKNVPRRCREEQQLPTLKERDEEMQRVAIAAKPEEEKDPNAIIYHTRAACTKNVTRRKREEHQLPTLGKAKQASSQSY